MTIDEAITKYKEIANTDANCPIHCMRPCDECVQECGQVADWLEELKDYRDKNKMVVRIDCINSEEFNDFAVKLAKEQYNKAIDDFVNECICYEHLTFEQEHIERIQAIGEQLKAGGENEI